MHKMPAIWLNFAKLLGKQKLISRTRQVYDQALVALPVTQHDIIWNPYLEWARELDNAPETAKYVWERYLIYKPEGGEDYIDYLLKVDDLERATEIYV